MPEKMVGLNLQGPLVDEGRNRVEIGVSDGAVGLRLENV